MLSKHGQEPWYCLIEKEPLELLRVLLTLFMCACVKLCLQQLLCLLVLITTHSIMLASHCPALPQE